MQYKNSVLYEESAGWIVYRKHGDLIQILLLKWRNAREKIEYVLPKGHIEWCESYKDTALREINEETWLPLENLHVIKFLNKIQYSFIAIHKRWMPIINKDVYLFLVKYNWDTEVKAQKSERFIWFEWVTIESLKTKQTKPNVYDFVKKNLIYMD